jgi:hypothetical protein
MSKKKATPKKESSFIQSQLNDSKKPTGKLDAMFLRFAKGERHHRFSAESIGDHCIPTTVSDLQKRHAIYFSRKLVKVPNRFGSQTSVMFYWLEGDNLTKAQIKSGLRPKDLP